MSPETGLRISHIAIVVGTILIALGGYGKYYFQGELEKIKESKIAEEKAIQSIPKLHS